MYVLSRFSHVWLFMTLWIVVHQAPLSMGFSRQESWSGLLCPPARDLPNPGAERMSQADSLPLAPPRKPTRRCRRYKQVKHLSLPSRRCSFIKTPGCTCEMLTSKGKAAEKMWQWALLIGNTIPEITEEKNVEFFKTVFWDNLNS